jgi:hypothetical protein
LPLQDRLQDLTVDVLNSMTQRLFVYKQLFDGIRRVPAAFPGLTCSPGDSWTIAFDLICAAVLNAKRIPCGAARHDELTGTIKPSQPDTSTGSRRTGGDTPRLDGLAPGQGCLVVEDAASAR